MTTCDCEPDLTDGRFAHECDYCATPSSSTHCAHYEHPDPCPKCNVVPVPAPVLR